MVGGVALPLNHVPGALIAQHNLRGRVYNRNDVDELHFLAREEPRLLPVLLDGVLGILPWGNRRGDSAKLPLTLWTSLATIEPAAGATRESRKRSYPARWRLTLGSGIR